MVVKSAKILSAGSKMQALQTIDLPPYDTCEGPQWHRRSYHTPPLITPGKYRPLEYPEIYAAIKESTPLYDDSATDHDYMMKPWYNDYLATARHYYGRNVQILTEDMARQFAGRLVYSISDLFYLPKQSFVRGTTRKDLITHHLSLGLFSRGSLYEPLHREPRDSVTYYTYDNLPLLVDDNCQPYGLPRSIDPYWAPERVLPIDRCGLVLDESHGNCIYVLAEKLD